MYDEAVLLDKERVVLQERIGSVIHGGLEVGRLLSPIFRLAALAAAGDTRRRAGESRPPARLSRFTLSQAPREGGVSGRSHLGSSLGGANGDHS